MLRPGYARRQRTPARIVEIKTTLSGRVDRFVCDVAERSDERVVLIYRIGGPGREVHGVWLPAGTVTVGYFWPARPFNLYHWIGPDGATLAYYFNVGDVVRYERHELEWLDLAVDVLATPGGRVEVLDEDELPPDLDPDVRRYVEQTRDHVLRDLPALMQEAERDSAAILRRDA